MDFNHPTWNYEGESPQVGQDFSPGALGYCLDNSEFPPVDPTHRAPVAHPHPSLIPVSYHSPYEQTTIPLPNYPHPHHCQPSTHDTVPGSILTDGRPPYDIPSTNQPDIHQSHETQLQAFPAYNSLELPDSVSLMTLPCPQSLPGDENGPPHVVSGYHSQPEVGTLPPSTFDGSGEGAPSHPPPHSIVGSASNSGSHAAYPCQCVTDGLTCHDEVAGTVGAVRNHLKQAHNLYASGKDAVTCPWTECHKPMQAENLSRHIVTCHFRVKVRCTACGVLLSRRDVQYSHANACPGRRGGGSGGASSLSSSSSLRFEPYHRRARS